MEKKKTYFTFKELLKTDQPYVNIPEMLEHVTNILKLIHVLNELRELFDAPIVVNSGFRTPEVNAAVQGSANSYHLYGRAADIRPAYSPSSEFYVELDILRAIVNQNKAKFVEVIHYPTFIHVAI